MSIIQYIKVQHQILLQTNYFICTYKATDVNPHRNYTLILVKITKYSRFWNYLNTPAAARLGNLAYKAM